MRLSLTGVTDGTLFVCVLNVFSVVDFFPTDFGSVDKWTLTQQPLCWLHQQRVTSHRYYVCGRLFLASSYVADCSVMLPGLLTMYQQIGSFGPAAKHKTVSGHVPT